MTVRTTRRPSDMAASTTTPLLGAANTLAPRKVITQTITYADYTTTATVMLGAGDPPSSVPSASPNEDQGSHSLPSPNIGIITGSIVGAILLALFIWVCCVVRRRNIEAEIYQHEQERDSEIAVYQFVQQPAMTYWPRFSMSTPPPVVPMYWATYPRTLYTANGAAATPDVFYEDWGWR
ncbi:hypothetical protein GGS21DRAFT_492998 [Xylaria nigripes]|nr:hypothetical protein GGS21DRAFT_492998 [Xylaria nigripes]